MTTRRWITTEPAGAVPAGAVIDLITITGSGGPTDPSARDFHLDGGGGDGQWLRIRHPNGLLIGMVRADSEVGAAFIAKNSERNHPS